MATTIRSARTHWRQAVMVGTIAFLATACGSSSDGGSATTAASSDPTTTTVAGDTTTVVSTSDSTVVSTSDSTAASTTASTSDSTPESDVAASGTRVVDSAYGEIEIPVDPQRVVAVSYDTPWQLQAAGVVPVAVQDYGTWISEFSESQQAFVDGIPTIGAYGELNFDRVAAAAPDLIVGDAYEIDEDTFATLSAIAPTVIVTGASRGDWKAISSAIADAAGAGDTIDAAAVTYDAELARLRDTYAEQLALSWIHFSLGNVSAEFSVQYPSGTIGAMLFDELGATLAASVPDRDPVAGYESFPQEQIGDILGGADVLVHPLNPDGSDNVGVRAVMDSAFFATLPAVADGNVFGLTISVTDYITATEYLQQIETTILQPLAG